MIHQRAVARNGGLAWFRFGRGRRCGSLRRMNAIDLNAAKSVPLTTEERDARTNEFLASEDFAVLVLKCLTEAARDAAAENAALGLTEQQSK